MIAPVPIPITEIIAALEREAANTDTDPRWRAASELRRVKGWQSRTLMCSPDDERVPEDDLVERLREEAKDPRFDTSNFHCDLITEAADEIERLRRAAARTVPPLLIMQAARRLIDWDARSTRGPEVNTVVVSDVVDDALKIARYVAAGRPEPHDEPRHDSSLSRARPPGRHRGRVNQ